mmetsp:Transcript_19870/g.51851  ORF Transcript_19870/g.51851 Transcript_19870/m.51851 type:complete len:373 (+) Transcript_19870:14-1132(+)
MRRGASENKLASAERKLRERASFELAEDEVEALRTQYAQLDTGQSRLHASVASAARVQTAKEAEFSNWKIRYPSVLEGFESFSAAAHGKRLAVFLDYDGTLTPIVKNPDEAFMSEKMRDSVKLVAKMYPTAIISGRGREKVEDFVKLRGLYYAGSHGLDIVGPREESGTLTFQPASKFEPIMDSVFAQLTESLKVVPGATTEHNKFCVSVHFRNCDPADYAQVEGITHQILSQHASLKLNRGRKVLEIKPQVDWNKGKALQHLLEALELHQSADVMPIYLGDDRTDEDAFKVLRELQAGCGILVSNKAKPTAAKYHLRDPSEVHKFLDMLVEWGHKEGNGWHSNVHCNGWTPVYSKSVSDRGTSAQLEDLES